MTAKETQLISFLIAKLEGGYANIKGDKGGETYCGIARNFWPKWDGWKVIDEYKKRKPIRHNQILDNKTLTDKVYSFYGKHFYSVLKVEAVKYPLLYAHLFCYGVHAGATTAATLVQQSVNAVTQANIKVDGVIGPVTLAHLNGEHCPAITEDFVERIRVKYSKSKWSKAFANRLHTISVWCATAIVK